jgi:serine/threonine-protein kinase RsbT
MNFSATDAAFVATTVSELARMLLEHTPHGEVSLQPVRDNGRVGVVIVARDPSGSVRAGEGSTLASGRALPDVCRLVDEVDFATDQACGTTITASKWGR